MELIAQWGDWILSYVDLPEVLDCSEEFNGTRNVLRIIWM
jgi:hypothetical protein